MRLLKHISIAGLILLAGCLILPAHATLSGQAVQTVTGAGTGATVNYTIGFTFDANSDIQVFLEDTSVTPHTRTALVYGSGASQFTITGGDPGTTVHMGTAPTSSQRLIIKRFTPRTQTVSYDEASAFPAADHEAQMDRMTEVIQELGVSVLNKIGLADGSTATVPVFPDPVANTFIQYNSSGQLGASTASQTTTNLGALTVANNLSDVNSASTSRSNLGLGTAATQNYTTATFNANKIQGTTVDASSIANNKGLVYNSGTGNIEFQTIAGLGVLPIANGGTNSSTALNNNRVMQSSGGAVVEASAITASRALVSDANGIPTNAAATTTTEIGYVNGVTSSLCGINQACAVTNKTVAVGSNSITSTASKVAIFDASGLLGASTLGLPTSTSTASAVAARDSNGDLAVNDVLKTYNTTATAAGTTTLTVASAPNQFFTGSTTQSLVLPAANTLALGQQFDVTNNSSGVVTVKDNGSNTIQAMAASSHCVATVTNIGSANGTWNCQYAINNAGGGTVTSVAATVPAELSVAGSPITTSGTLAVTWATEAARTFLSGPSNGSAAAPTFKTLTAPTLQTFTSTGSATGWLFTVTAANATVGATYTNNSNTYTVLGTIASGTLLTMSGTGATSGGTLTKSAGTGDATITFSSKVALATYTTPTNPVPIALRVRMVGGGGGGGGSGTAGGSAATVGGNTVFGIPFTLAGGGGLGSISGSPTVGGTGTLGSGASGIAINGAQGGGGGANTGALADYCPGGNGGQTYLGGGGGMCSAGGAGGAAATNSGSGGGGGCCGTTASSNGGNGGGAGAYAEFLIASPATTYPYVVGAAGGAGGAGTNGFAGGAGAAGYIEVTEIYQ